MSESFVVCLSRRFHTTRKGEKLWTDVGESDERTPLDRCLLRIQRDLWKSALEGKKTRSVGWKRSKEGSAGAGSSRKSVHCRCVAGTAWTLSAITNCDFGSRTRCCGRSTVTWLIVTSWPHGSLDFFHEIICMSRRIDGNAGKASRARTWIARIRMQRATTPTCICVTHKAMMQRKSARNPHSCQNI